MGCKQVLAIVATLFFLLLIKISSLPTKITSPFLHKLGFQFVLQNKTLEVNIQFIQENWSRICLHYCWKKSDLMRVKTLEYNRTLGSILTGVQSLSRDTG